MGYIVLNKVIQFKSHVVQNTFTLWNSIIMVPPKSDIYCSIGLGIVVLHNNILLLLCCYDLIQKILVNLQG